MFSLIITVIAIALVTVLALVTIYYGGSAFNQGRAAADAARFVNDGQQLTGATSLYAAKEGAYPASLQVLVDTGYLSAIPASVALNSPSNPNLLIPTAYANAAGSWAMPLPSRPLFIYSAPPTVEVCREINRKVRGDNGILSLMVDGLEIQCYGSTTLTIVAGLSGTGAMLDYATSLGESLATGVPTSPADALWRNPPDVTVSVAAPTPVPPTGPAPATSPTGFGSNPEVGPAPDPNTDFLAASLSGVDTSVELYVQYRASYGNEGVAFGVTNNGTTPITDPTFSIVSNVAGKWVVDAVQPAPDGCRGTPTLAPGASCQINISIGPGEPGLWTADAVVSYTTSAGRRTQIVPMRQAVTASTNQFWTTSQYLSSGIDSPMNYSPDTADAGTYLVEIYNNSPTQDLIFGNVALADGTVMTATSDCGGTVAPYSACMVTVAWPAGVAGGRFDDTLNIQMTDHYFGQTTKSLPVSIKFPP